MQENQDQPSIIAAVAAMTKEEAIAAGWPEHYWKLARRLVTGKP